MNVQFAKPSKSVISLVVAGFLVAGCSAGPTRPDGADSARDKLTKLQADPQLASRAPVAIKEAEAAVKAAEAPQSDKAVGAHLVNIANRRVDIATAQAQTRLSEDERQDLSQQREAARLNARTQEADSARRDATVAQSDAEQARMDAEAARQAMTDEQQRSAALRDELAALNARETDRGLVVTLGDLLFATGKSDLVGGAASNLGKLAAFLNTYEDRTVMIEGHTDSVGSADFNQGLSQRRADSVKAGLVRSGVSASRLSATGMGLNSPIADNGTATGRQQNRRVEVIISNAASAAR